MFSAVFFNIQMFFVSTYFLLAIIIVFLERINAGRIIFVTVISVAAAFLFFLSVIFTDFVFKTGINSVLVRISGNNSLRYGVLFILEGFFVGSLLYFMKEKVRKAYSASLRKQ